MQARSTRAASTAQARIPADARQDPRHDDAEHEKRRTGRDENAAQSFEGIVECLERACDLRVSEELIVGDQGRGEHANLLSVERDSLENLLAFTGSVEDVPIDRQAAVNVGEVRGLRS